MFAKAIPVSNTHPSNDKPISKDSVLKGFTMYDVELSKEQPSYFFGTVAEVYDVIMFLAGKTMPHANMYGVHKFVDKMLMELGEWVNYDSPFTPPSGLVSKAIAYSVELKTHGSNESDKIRELREKETEAFTKFLWSEWHNGKV